jgi:hypothetical protein
MNQEQILSAVRTLLKIAGTALVTKGITTDATLESAIGAIITIVGIIWSAKTHKETKP